MLDLKWLESLLLNLVWMHRFGLLISGERDGCKVVGLSVVSTAVGIVGADGIKVV